MEEGVLAAKGIKPVTANSGFVEGYRLRIGERATLVRRPGSRAYGIMMGVTPGEVKELYAEKSVAEYLPETLTVELMDGTKVDATCYNLPLDKVTGANREYAKSLLEVCTRLGFPDSYLEQIRQSCT